jgi:hypothetical protein
LAAVAPAQGAMADVDGRVRTGYPVTHRTAHATTGAHGSGLPAGRRRHRPIAVRSMCHGDRLQNRRPGGNAAPSGRLGRADRHDDAPRGPRGHRYNRAKQRSNSQISKRAFCPYFVVTCASHDACAVFVRFLLVILHQTNILSLNRRCDLASISGVPWRPSKSSEVHV